MRRSLNLRSRRIPGDPQGTSNVGDGRDSEQADRGELSRRATTRRSQIAGDGRATTAEPGMNRSINTGENQRASPFRHVAQQRAVPRRNEQTRRMHWTNEMNKAIMTAYYRATNLEADRTFYRRRMREEFLRFYPQLDHLSEQRISDQQRAIIRRDLLSDPILDEIKNDVRCQNEMVQPPLVQVRNDDLPEVQYEEHDRVDLGLENYFETLCMQYRGSDPCSRPPLSKLRFRAHTGALINTLNNIIQSKLNTDADLEEIHLMIYCAARTVLEKNQKIHSTSNARRRESKPKWEIKLEEKIEKTRKIVIHSFIALKLGNKRSRILKKLPKKMYETLIQTPASAHQQLILDNLDTMKQQLAVYAHRLRSYKESNERKKQNALFEKNERRFYRDIIEKKYQTRNTCPKMLELERFWEEIWSKEMTPADLSRVLSRLPNWKAPGRDKVKNFWIKEFSSTHPYISEEFNNILRQPSRCPKFFTQGVTYLLPKGENKQDPAQYRPITCLPTLFKILTALITEKITNHLKVNHLMTEEQKGSRRGVLGCKEQLVVDEVVLEHIRRSNRNAYMAFIDYKKAFDSVPHSWLIHALKIHKVSPDIVSFLETSMRQWSTVLTLHTTEQIIQSKEIPIRRGIFQGDPLSAPWFCLALNPLSSTIVRMGHGIKIKTEQNTFNLTHLFFMDDLKIYTSSKRKLEIVLKQIHKMSTDIGMEFGLNKCKTVTVHRGTLQHTEPLQITTTTQIECLSEEPYKYLGILQTNKINHSTVKEELRTEFNKRLQTVLKTKLNSRNLTKAINTYVIPALSYSFGVIKWSQTDLEDLNRRVRTALTRARMHHPKSSCERVNLPRGSGCRGIVDIENLHNGQVENMRRYFYSRRDRLLHHTIIQADNKLTPLDLKNERGHTYACNQQKLLSEWKSKQLHGRFCRALDEPHVDKPASVRWLTQGYLNPETEGSMIAIQDQVVKTRNYSKFILKEDIQSDQCRLCAEKTETIDHIISGCTKLAKTRYIERHNQVAKIVYLELLKMCGMEHDDTPYYKYEPNAVRENVQFKIYWDKTILTNRTVQHNRPDITLVDRRKKKTYLIDVAVPSAHNLQQKYEEKLLKYEILAQDVRQIWGMQSVDIVPLIISGVGIIPKTLKSNLSKLSIPENTYVQMQKAVILQTAAIVRSVIG
ncbi:uncharacterized protein LOC123318276 [Coccinella septempunctata]|uniref:uncharacterized protein LOC123318276 n=1 Tax=Coccinella septempunctata TaxID=41139 RepID=UPI001D079F2C|nr:uncharacterized protein LOC123318276 [Coccinella septempunctata]